MMTGYRLLTLEGHAADVTAICAHHKNEALVCFCVILTLYTCNICYEHARLMACDLRALNRRTLVRRFRSLQVSRAPFAFGGTRVIPVQACKSLTYA
jgi:hypothetical protein